MALSVYELERLANIADNHRRLIALGLKAVPLSTAPTQRQKRQAYALPPSTALGGLAIAPRASTEARGCARRTQPVVDRRTGCVLCAQPVCPVHSLLTGCAQAVHSCVLCEHRKSRL